VKTNRMKTNRMESHMKRKLKKIKDKNGGIKHMV
jgi:hypothetical protein